MPCHCEQCTDQPGETCTENHRHKCEVNYVAKQSGAWIKEFLEGVKEKRGSDAYRKVREDVLKVWNK